MLVADVLVLLVGGAVLALLAVAVRRRLLQRAGGTVELAVRLRPHARGGGWALGLGRFAGDDLQWFRFFSLSPRPRRVLSRADLAVTERRAPRDGEAFALSKRAVVMQCRTARGPVELGMDPGAVTGFLAWLEARPPGATLPRV